jgi:uncharacterized protein
MHVDAGVGLGRILVLVALIFVGLLLFRSLVGGGARRRSSRSAKPPVSEKVLACRVCGLHVPESEGVMSADRFYCCEDHRLRDSSNT